MEAPAPGSGLPAKAAPIDDTLSAISTTSITITRFLRSVRAAHAELAAVTRELSDLRLLLELMREEQDIPLLLQAQVLALIQDCRATVLKVRESLEGCTSTAQWTSTTKPDITALRPGLEIFRRALALVLEVVHLSTLPAGSGDVEIQDTEHLIHSEVAQLRLEAALVEYIDQNAIPVLESYLSAIVNCLQGSDGSSSPHSQDSRSRSIGSIDAQSKSKVPQARSEPPTAAIEDGLEVVHLDEQPPAIHLVNSSPTLASDSSSNAHISRQYENAGPWHPTKDIVLPFYSPSPQPSTANPTTQPITLHQPLPPRPSLSHSVTGSESPISPHTIPQRSPQSAVPVQSLGQHQGQYQGVPFPASSLSQQMWNQQMWNQQMWNQQMWRYNMATSPSIRSDSFDSRLSSPYKHPVTSDAWPDPARDFGSGYTFPTSAPSPDQSPYHSPRDPSIDASISPGRSISTTSTIPIDSPRSNFSTTRPDTPTTVSTSYQPGRSGTDTPTSFASLGKMSTSSAYSAQLPSLTPTGHWPPPRQGPSFSSYPSPPYQPNNPMSSSSSATSKPSLVEGNSPSPGFQAPAHYPTLIDIIPTRHLTDKGKPHDVFHIDCSPTSSYIATKHSNNHIKIWSVIKNTVHSNTKITSYVTPQARSREYFINSHAILSESATLIAITTHFGFNLEIHNFSKTSSFKKLQTIDDAHRWAASKRDAYQTNYAPLVVYRPKPNRIDKFFLARHPAAKKPFWEDASNCIELAKANLPFIPQFPELAYSSNSPFLIAAAGPRPGAQSTPENPNITPNPNNTTNNIILIAWQMTPVPDSKLQSRSPALSSRASYHSDNSRSDSSSLIEGNIPPSSASSPHSDSSHPHNRHRPHRYITPTYPSLQNSLPSVLVAHGTTCVSIWIPANHADIPLPGGKFRRAPVSAPERFVLVWDFMTNATRMFGIPNVQACVSPDCRYVAYCNPGTAGNGKFVIIDVGSGEKIWRWPAREGETVNTARRGVAQTPWASFGGQMENLAKITVFEFSGDGKMLIIGDASGGLGVYEVSEAGHGPGGRYELGEVRGAARSPPWMGGINELQS